MRMSKNLEDKIRQMQPLIILGMHRSGTSLTVRLLKDLGMHMGSTLSRDAEAVYFQKINRMIYRSAGSNWGVIDALLTAMNSETFVDFQAKKVSSTLFPDKRVPLFNKGIADYFGESGWDQLNRNEDFWWGWKDPRTTITFPVWMKIFPQARFVNILRNGIDVAVSIHRRSLKQSKKLWKRAFPLDYIPRTLDFDYCFRLWEMHVSYVEEKKSLISPDRYLDVRYEDLLSDPHKNLQTIADFMDFPLQDKNLDAVCEQIDSGRLVNTKNARPYWDHIRYLVDSPWMQKFKYEYPVEVNG